MYIYVLRFGVQYTVLYSSCCGPKCMSRKWVETSFGFSRETAGAVKIAQLPAWRWWRWKLQMTNTPSLHHYPKYEIKSKVNSKMNDRVSIYWNMWTEIINKRRTSSQASKLRQFENTTDRLTDQLKGRVKCEQQALLKWRLCFAPFPKKEITQLPILS